MKTLLLFRHAKSDWSAGHPDAARPLAPRGVAAAAKMGRLLTAARLTPDAALASSAVRTRETLALAAEAGQWNGPARFTDALYEATPQAVLAEIHKESDATRTLVVVGHEPTTSTLASLIAGGGRIEVKTATVVQINIDVERWVEVGPGRGVLAALLAPGVLRVGAYRALKKRTQDGDRETDAR